MSKKNNLDWKAYESLTKYIYETLGQKDRVKIVGHGPNFKFPGKSGVSHQIDLLTSHSDGASLYLTAIECKYWNKKIGKDAVMKLYETIQDSDIHKGIIVSYKGFTKDGITFAKHKNIELVELRDISSSDPESMKRNMNFGELEVRHAITVRGPTILKAMAVTSENLSIEFDHQNSYHTLLHLPDGKRISLSHHVDSFQKELHHQQQINQIITKEYDIPNGSVFIKGKDNPVEIIGLIFNGVLVELDKSSKQVFSLQDKVSLIMKSISENRSFRISENGIIEVHKE